MYGGNSIMLVLNPIVLIVPQVRQRSSTGDFSSLRHRANPVCQAQRSRFCLRETSHCHDVGNNGVLFQYVQRCECRRRNGIPKIPTNCRLGKRQIALHFMRISIPLRIRSAFSARIVHAKWRIYQHHAVREDHFNVLFNARYLIPLLAVKQVQSCIFTGGGKPTIRAVLYRTGIPEFPNCMGLHPEPNIRVGEAGSRRNMQIQY